MPLDQDTSAPPSEEQISISLPTILQDILSGKAPRPYSANAFVDFVSQKHCSESLDFIVKVQDYHNLFTCLQTFFNKRLTQEAIVVTEEWDYLIKTFISPGSPCELNLPSSIRNELLSHDSNPTPPRPDYLDSAVRHTAETLTDNILIPFLRSSPISNFDATPPVPLSSHHWANSSNSSTSDTRPPLKRSPR